MVSFFWNTRFRALGLCTKRAATKDSHKASARNKLREFASSTAVPAPTVRFLHGLVLDLWVKKSLGSTQLSPPSDSNGVRPSKPDSLAEPTCHQNQGKKKKINIVFALAHSEYFAGIAQTTSIYFSLF